MFNGVRLAVRNRRLGSYLRFKFKLHVRASFRLVWKPLHCAVCGEWFNRRNIVGGIENDYACRNCVASHNGPGRFERYSFSDEDGYNHDSEDLAKVLVLQALMLDSCEDDYMSSEGWGYCGRFGRFLLYQDDRGFVTFDEYQDIERAEKEFTRLYCEGWGADEDDAYIQADGSVWFAGKQLDVWTPQNAPCDYDDERYISDRRRIARVRLESMRQGFYPNLWLVSDHGNLTNVSY